LHRQRCAKARIMPERYPISQIGCAHDAVGASALGFWAVDRARARLLRSAD